MLENRRLDEMTEEEAAPYLAARRMLKYRLGAAGLLRPNRARTAESEALERQIRQEVQSQLDATLASIAERERLSRYPTSNGEYVTGLEKSFAETMAYTWLLQLQEDAAAPGASSQLVADWNTVKDWLEIGDSINEPHFKMFASGWASYVGSEEAPTEELRGAWTLMRAEMGQPTIALDPRLRSVFGRLIASDKEFGAERSAAPARDRKSANLTESERLKFEQLFDEAARIAHKKDSPPRANYIAGAVGITMGLLAYPIWLGAHERSFEHVAGFAAILAVMLFFFGPKAEDVQHNPSRPLVAIFSLILASGLSALGYGVGYFIWG